VSEPLWWASARFTRVLTPNWRQPERPRCRVPPPGSACGPNTEILGGSRRLVRVMSPFATPPYRAAVWLEPPLLAEISSELMEGWVRDPVYRRLM
jgi:hypothetical protein